MVVTTTITTGGGDHHKYHDHENKNARDEKWMSIHDHEKMRIHAMS